MLRRALILDCETQGLDPAQHRCIEVACILFDLELALPIEAFSTLIQADSNAAEAINCIPVRALVDASPPERAWAILRRFIERADVVLAHRAEFDRGFVPPELAKLRPWACTKFHVQWPRGQGGEHLVHLALAHGVGVVHSHRAMTDVDILSRLLTRVHEMGHTLPELLTHAMRPRVRVQALVSYDDREKAKGAGFQWEGATKMWTREVPVDEVSGLGFETRVLR
jgi:DNA polymerase-3 subunit epsilon